LPPALLDARGDLGDHDGRGPRRRSLLRLLEPRAFHPGGSGDHRYRPERRMVTGRCQCGAVRYRHSAAPRPVSGCHCRECRHQPASAFGIWVEMPAEGLEVTQGKPKYWPRDTDSGRKLRCAFCPDCGSRLWHESDAGWITLKGGSLDEEVDL